ncbi:DUF1501 domain-containing protein [Acuticoccus sediminis]|uniref:DUF1501 domain-containing protein n=1 Tax=Acuticoccus sediminis TaxID=2184697 RepID=UPI001CFD787A|nr:DUF1501 domain-containing protein [Acuticoccus sediminis]
MLHPTRRSVLIGGAAFTAWASIPTIARAAGSRDPRFVALILRGGMDGLAVVAPIGDPSYEAVRDEFSMPLEGPDAGIPLDGFFVLNPRMTRLAELYRKGEALFVHAAHTAYRERSHFDAQDVLENGTTAAAHYKDGWLGRIIQGLPADGDVAKDGAFAAATTTPLTLRGAPRVVTWLPPGFAEASDDTRSRLLMMYEHTDPVLARAMAEGLDLSRVTGSEVETGEAVKAMLGTMEANGFERQVVAAATAAGRAMSTDDGPRVGFLDMSGFDTHLRQSVTSGRIGRALTALDLSIGALRDSLGDAWDNTVVAVMTEFGRTVRMNGSDGTDHGTATVAMLLGGAVKGGRVYADWPGLAPNALFEGRDLAPTTDLRAVLKGVARDHLGLDPRMLGGSVFPGTEGLRPIDGLVRRT